MSKIEKAQKTAYKNYSNGYKAGREAERLRNKKELSNLLSDMKKNTISWKCNICIEGIRNRLEKEEVK